ncbi:MAG TPA: hypothetical protein VMZ53_34220 [Kofleriaceae bacterium]|nr:hypothetical protein [Kofleriaceae bacterium]
MNARIVVVLLVSLAGCYRTKNLAAPPTPSPQLPAVPLSGAPGPGLTRVVLDVEDGPAVVEELHGGSLSGATGSHVFGGSLQVAQRVCVTPCVFDTKPGGHELRFTLADDSTRTSVGFVNADQRVSAYRHALGRDRSSAWKGFVGWPLLVAGALLDVGMVSALSDGREMTGGSIAGAAFSVGITALGGWLVYGSVVEKQPGSGTQWYPE